MPSCYAKFNPDFCCCMIFFHTHLCWIKMHNWNHQSWDPAIMITTAARSRPLPRSWCSSEGRAWRPKPKGSERHRTTSSSEPTESTKPAKTGQTADFNNSGGLFPQGPWGSPGGSPWGIPGGPLGRRTFGSPVRCIGRPRDSDGPCAGHSSHRACSGKTCDCCDRLGEEDVAKKWVV